MAPGCRILVSKRNMIIPHVEEKPGPGQFLPGCRDPTPVPLLREPTRIHETKGRGEDGEERIIRDPVLRQCRLRNPGASSSSSIL